MQIWPKIPTAFKVASPFFWNDLKVYFVFLKLLACTGILFVYRSAFLHKFFSDFFLNSLITCELILRILSRLSVHRYSICLQRFFLIVQNLSVVGRKSLFLLHMYRTGYWNAMRAGPPIWYLFTVPYGTHLLGNKLQWL